MLKNKEKDLYLKAINAERKLNYTNSGVVGGFSNHFLRILGKYPETDLIQDGLKKYSSLKKPDKIKLLQLLESWVKNKEVELVSKPKATNSALSAQLTDLPGVGPKRIKDLAKLGIRDIEDLIYYFPKRYEDRTVTRDFYKLEHASQATIIGEVIKTEVLSPRPRLNILRVHLAHGKDTIIAVFFNQRFLQKNFKPGKIILVSGKVDFKFGKQIIVSDYEILSKDEKTQNLGGIIPIYPLTGSINQKLLRKLIGDTLKNYIQLLEEILPLNLQKLYNLLPLNIAIKEIHFPQNWLSLKRARYTLVFYELLIFHLGIKSSRNLIKVQKGIEHEKNNYLTQKFIESLPFKLTKAQLRTIKEIEDDMESPQVMYRLIQGDVGSGKTMVALWALIKAVSGGYQGALMVPTEILAEQHYLNLKEILDKLNIETILLTGSISKKDKEEKLNKILSGKGQIIIGTHALIQEDVSFHNLGLIIIDEQHRFGVKQRLALQEKGVQPDVLVMTATPIPRTLALSLYGDMDISIIDELPPGRKTIKTYHITENRKNEVYSLIRKEINKGQQAYIICPLVDESDKLDLINATETARILATEVFPDYKVGLIHGQVKKEEKEIVMESFRKGELNILVATTVVEVGVNIPNATVMVILNAERFGLAQLHQLRGRVGRGALESFCILVSNAKTQEARSRMEIMTKSNDGFLIAEEDLLLRGPGDFFGIKQHGLPDLKIADLVRDIDVLEKTKKLAEEILKNGWDKKEFLNLKKEVLKKFQKTNILKA